MKYFVLLPMLLSLYPEQGLAYIPRMGTIAKKMTSNSGRREYKIVREVTLQSPNQEVKAREVWTVAHGDKMKLEVSSLDETNPWKFAIVYSKSKRQTLTQNKQLKTFAKSPDFFEPLFHDRFHKSLLSRLINYRFVPEWVKDTPTPSYEDGQTKMAAQAFIALAPMEGSISYAIGAQSNGDGGQNQTRIWVEQDSFLIKKVHGRSGAQMINSNFQSFTGGLKIPGEQSITWGDRVAKVKLLTAERTKSKKKTWQLSASESGTIPTTPLIKEFYSRFR